MEPADPEKFADPDRPCVCGHDRDCHDLVQGHEVCLWGWPANDGPTAPTEHGDEPCTCEDYQPEEEHA